MKIDEVKKCCETCEFNMPINGKLVCAGRTEEYGQITPIKNVNYNECWEISYHLYEQCEDIQIYPF